MLSAQRGGAVGELPDRSTAHPPRVGGKALALAASAAASGASPACGGKEAALRFPDQKPGASPHAGKTGDVVSKRPADLASHARRQENRNFSGRRYRPAGVLSLSAPCCCSAPPRWPHIPARKNRKRPHDPCGALFCVLHAASEKERRKPASFTIMRRALYAKRLCAAQRSFRFSSASAAQDTGLPCLLLPARKNAPQGRHSFF